LVVLIILVIIAVLSENAIHSRIKDIEIMKSDISDEKAIFIPVKALDTNIIAVMTSDGKYRLAFDDCTGCYSQYGKHFSFKNNSENTGLICKNCKSEVMYDEMGFLPEQSMPLPISIEMIADIEELEDRILIKAEYLEKMKQELNNMRNGKLFNNYSENPNK